MSEPANPAQPGEEPRDDAMDAKVFDYYEGTLPAAERPAVEAYLRARGEPLDAPPELTSGLQSLRRAPVVAPETFERDVTATIEKRSGGRFFARPSFIDRVPLRLLLLLVALLAAGYLLLARTSSTGGARLRQNPSPQAPQGSGAIVTPP